MGLVHSPSTKRQDMLWMGLAQFRQESGSALHLLQLGLHIWAWRSTLSFRQAVLKSCLAAFKFDQGLQHAYIYWGTTALAEGEMLATHSCVYANVSYQTSPAGVKDYKSFNRHTLKCFCVEFCQHLLLAELLYKAHEGLCRRMSSAWKQT